MSEIKETYKLHKEGNLWVTEILGKQYGFRKWTWGEKNSAASQATSLNPLTGVISYDSAKFNNQLMLATVHRGVKGKFEKFSEKELNELDGQTGERLFQLTQKLNLVRNIEAQNL